MKKNLRQHWMLRFLIDPKTSEDRIQRVNLIGFLLLPAIAAIVASVWVLFFS